MSISIDLPPSMEKEVRGYAMASGMTVEQFVFDCLKAELERRRDARLAMDKLDELAATTSE